ncbi:hypothetical protein M2437_004665 [Methylorubrum pseudosasae]|nr:hypothetical protein [Methylorubrum pseudosasae]
MGPAATMAARLATGWVGKLTARSCGLMRATASGSGTLAPLASPTNFT